MYRHAYSRFGCGTPITQQREGYRRSMTPSERERFVFGMTLLDDIRKNRWNRKATWPSLRRTLVQLQRKLAGPQCTLAERNLLRKRIAEIESQLLALQQNLVRPEAKE